MLGEPGPPIGTTWGREVTQAFLPEISGHAEGNLQPGMTAGTAHGTRRSYSHSMPRRSPKGEAGSGSPFLAEPKEQTPSAPDRREGECEGNPEQTPSAP